MLPEMLPTCHHKGKCRIQTNTQTNVTRAQNIFSHLMQDVQFTHIFFHIRGLQKQNPQQKWYMPRVGFGGRVEFWGRVGVE